MSIVIESGIPLPRPRRSTDEIREAIPKMKVGDSFVLHRPQEMTARVTAQKANIKVELRRQDETFTRVWRTA